MTNEVAVAWVSAGAAVVQAVGAVAAIWYSGKLARDSARREKAADEAAQMRADEADRKAEQRMVEFDAAARKAARSAERERHNQPIQRALDLARRACADFKDKHEHFRRATTLEQTHFQSCTPSHAQNVLIDQRTTLIDRAADAASAEAISELVEILRPFNEAAQQRAAEWQDLLAVKIDAAERKIDQLEGLLLDENF